MSNPLNNADDSHDPYFASPEEFDIAYEDSVCSDPDDDTDEGPAADDDYWWNKN
jgi:hypothetical protein